MSKILRKRDKLLRIKAGIIDVIRKEAIKNREFISELNRKQLLDGKKADGTDMPDYVEGSKQPAAPGKIILFQKGDFQEGIEPVFGDKELRVIGTDEKTPFLVAKYKKPLGLTVQSRKLLVEKMIPGVRKGMKEL